VGGGTSCGVVTGDGCAFVTWVGASDLGLAAAVGGEVAAHPVKASIPVAVSATSATWRSEANTAVDPPFRSSG